MLYPLRSPHHAFPATLSPPRFPHYALPTALSKPTRSPSLPLFERSCDGLPPPLVWVSPSQAIKSGWDEYGYGYGQPSQNITIRDNVLSTPCAAIAIGSEMSGGVSEVHVSRCHIWESTAGVHVKSGAGRGGYVHDVTFEQLTMDRCSVGLMYTIDTGGHPADDPTHHLNLSALPDIRRISARQITGTGSRQVARLNGLARAPLQELVFDGVHFDGGVYECSNVSGTYVDVEPTPCGAIRPRAYTTTEVKRGRGRSPY